MPINNPMIKLIKELLDPTAASASFPIKFPAMTESAVLYSCWNKFPIKSGIENSIILLIILPSVIVIFFSLFLFSILSPLLLFMFILKSCSLKERNQQTAGFLLNFVKFFLCILFHFYFEWNCSIYPITPLYSNIILLAVLYTKLPDILQFFLFPEDCCS